MKRIGGFGHPNNKINYFLYFIIIAPLITTSCMSKRELIDYKDVTSIKFWYLDKDFRTSADIVDCGEVACDTQFNKDTIITDTTTIKEYISVVNELKPARRHKDNYDLRVTSLIKFKTKEKK